MTQLLSPDIRPHPQALLLPWYLAGLLSEFQRQALAAHLTSCGRCRQELEAVIEMRHSIRDCIAAESGPSPDIERRVMDLIYRLAE